MLIHNFSLHKFYLFASKIKIEKIKKKIAIKRKKNNRDWYKTATTPSHHYAMPPKNNDIQIHFFACLLACLNILQKYKWIKEKQHTNPVMIFLSFFHIGKVLFCLLSIVYTLYLPYNPSNTFIYYVYRYIVSTRKKRKKNHY